MSYMGLKPKLTQLALLSGTDNAAGSAVTLSTPASGIIRLTNASLASVAGIPAGRDGEQVTLQNDTGANVVIVDNATATAANRIVTGQKLNCVLKDEESVKLEYSTSESRWMVRGYLLPVSFIVATGGTITTDGNFKIHTFNSSSTFDVASVGSLGSTVEYLVIGGGGAGGGYLGGGGGAGAYRTATGLAVTAQSYSVTVGAGGAGQVATSGIGNPGSDSIFSTITSNGGGGGGEGGVLINGGSNGNASGGGSSFGGTPGSAGAFGFAGGNSAGSPGFGGGGGGGSSAVGADGNTVNGGNGGAGTASSITGSAVTRAGGGGAGLGQMAAGVTGTGQAGGGNGSKVNGGNGSPATANTGSGGGGAGNQNTTTGGNGGSGVVIIRYQYQ